MIDVMPNVYPLAKDGRIRGIAVSTAVRFPGAPELPTLSESGVAGFESSPFGVEWMRYEPGSRVPELVRTVPHVAFTVDDLDAAIAGRQVLIAPKQLSPGVRVAFVVDNGAPIEFLEFNDPARAEADGLAPWGPPACRESEG